MVCKWWHCGRQFSWRAHSGDDAATAVAMIRERARTTGHFRQTIKTIARHMAPPSTNSSITSVRASVVRSLKLLRYIDLLVDSRTQMKRAARRGTREAWDGNLESSRFLRDKKHIKGRLRCSGLTTEQPSLPLILFHLLQRLRYRLPVDKHTAGKHTMTAANSIDLSAMLHGLNRPISL